MSISITEYRNAKVINEKGDIDVEIKHPEYGWIPYTLDVDDTDMTIDNSALTTLIGADKTAYVAPTAEEILAKKSQIVRDNRNWLLGEADKVTYNPLRWAAMTSTEQSAWATYRQSLLDLPTQAGFPDTVTWPTRPDGKYTEGDGSASQAP
jgi:hypothetical protein